MSKSYGNTISVFASVKAHKIFNFCGEATRLAGPRA